MSFLIALLNRVKSSDADDAFEKRMRRIQRSQPADARYQSLFIRPRRKDLAA